MTGEVLEVAKDMETRSYREPLGVVAAICPFSKLHLKQAFVTRCDTLWNAVLKPLWNHDANIPRLPRHVSSRIPTDTNSLQ